MKRLLVFMLSLCVVSLFGAVVINEFSVSQPGTDSASFVELYNSGDTDVDISGYQVVGINGSDGSEYATITIPSGTTLAAHDYYVIGYDSNIPNVDLTTNDVDFQNGPDQIVLKDASGNVIDSVTYGNANDDYSNLQTYLEGSTLGEHMDGKSCSTARIKDGYDTDNNPADFCMMVRTPGTSNEAGDPSITLPFEENFDSLNAGDPSTGFVGGFVNATATAPGTIPASPQGGNYGCFSDTSGGGNAVYFKGPNMTAFTIECYVYINAAALSGSDEEAWQIGKCNGINGYGHITNYYLPRIIDSGIYWKLYRDSTGTKLSLIKGDFAGNYTEIGSITLSDSDTGWQRLYLELKADGSVKGIYGGTYGDYNSGQTIEGTADVYPGPIVFAYREYCADNANATWLNADAVKISGTVDVKDWTLY